MVCLIAAAFFYGCGDSDDSDCEPTTCEAAGAQCGTISDGCGGELSCGTCDGGDSCNANNQCQTFETNPYNDHSPLGTNLNWTVDWSSEIKYVNVMKQSRPWTSCRISPWRWNWDDDGNLGTFDTDGDGWVRSLEDNRAACALMMWDVPMVPAGRYIVLYDGEGTLSYSRMGSAVKNDALSTDGRDVLDVPENAGHGISVCVESTNPDNYIKNIRVLLPGGVCSNDRFRHCDDGSGCQAPGTCLPFEQSYQTQPFNPVFLNDIKHFSVVRLMDMQEINNSPVQHWSDRKQPTAATYVGDEGVPVEVLVDLANTLEADPWVCMPHQADDDYMRRFAAYVKSALNPNLSVYLEYSNETWNGIFVQYHYVVEQGLAAGLGGDGDSANAYLAGNQYTSRRTVEMIEIWEEVFGGAGQLVRVMPGFNKSTWVTNRRMEFENAYEKIDALAIAPYFGNSTDGNNLDDIFDDLTDYVAEKRDHWNGQNARMTYWSQQADRPIKLIAYEAGQHMEASGMVDDVNRDPRMGALYTTYLNNWKADIGNLMVMYTSCMQFSSNSAWGLLEYPGQTGSPKYDAVITFIGDNPLPW
jgi:hypothetical protein